MVDNIKTPSEIEIAWLAGIYEGEGSFYWNKNTPAMAIQMVDADIIERVARIIGVKPRKPWRSKNGNRKLVHHVVICGTRAIKWMRLILPYMGNRRSDQIYDTIAQWYMAPGWPRGSRGERLPAICHPDRQRSGNGLCNTCYMREWRRKNGRNGTYYRNRKKQLEAR